MAITQQSFPISFKLHCITLKIFLTVQVLCFLSVESLMHLLSRVSPEINHLLKHQPTSRPPSACSSSQQPLSDHTGLQGRSRTVHLRGSSRLGFSTKFLVALWGDG